MSVNHYFVVCSGSKKMWDIDVYHAIYRCMSQRNIMKLNWDIYFILKILLIWTDRYMEVYLWQNSMFSNWYQIIQIEPTSIISWMATSWMATSWCYTNQWTNKYWLYVIISLAIKDTSHVQNSWVQVLYKYFSLNFCSQTQGNEFSGGSWIWCIHSPTKLNLKSSKEGQKHNGRLFIWPIHVCLLVIGSPCFVIQNNWMKFGPFKEKQSLIQVV